MRRRPSAERLRAPSEEALPLTMRALEPLSGMGSELTREPLVLNWSRKTELPWLPRVCEPSPTRSAARLTGVKWSGRSVMELSMVTIALDAPATGRFRKSTPTTLTRLVPGRSGMVAVQLDTVVHVSGAGTPPKRISATLIGAVPERGWVLLVMATLPLMVKTEATVASCETR